MQHREEETFIQRSKNIRREISVRYFNNIFVPALRVLLQNRVFQVSFRPLIFFCNSWCLKQHLQQHKQLNIKRMCFWVSKLRLFIFVCSVSLCNPSDIIQIIYQRYGGYLQYKNLTGW
jgi:hypothetical protein